MLPKVTRERWEYGGEAKLEHETVDTWVFKSEPGKGYGHYVSNYTLSVSKVSSLEDTAILPRKSLLNACQPYENSAGMGCRMVHL